MPNKVNPFSTAAQRHAQLQVEQAKSRKEFQYTYPSVAGKELELVPQEEFHDFVLEKVLHPAQSSRNYMQRFFPNWRKIDRTLSAFIPQDAKEASIKSRDPRKPTSIVIPQTYATLQTLRSAFMQIFLTGDVIHQYKPVGPEDVIGTALMEKNIKAQGFRFNHDLSHVAQIMDSLAYGVGPSTPVWTKQLGKRVIIERANQAIANLFGFEVEDGEVFRSFEDATLFEGNRIQNIDPYNYLPDPKVPVHEIQQGEFVGWGYTTTVQELLAREQNPDEKLFNVKFLALTAKDAARSSIIPGTDDDRQSWATQSTGATSDSFSSSSTISGVSSSDRLSDNDRGVDVVNLYMKIIPVEWGFSNSYIPEIWQLGIANDKFVIQMNKADFAHGMFPAAVGAPNFSGHEAIPVSNLMTVYGLQNLADWKINSDVANTRRALNMLFVADPSAIHLEDFLQGGAAKIIRLQQNMYGKGNIDQWIKQIPIQDVTQRNMQDLQVVLQLIQQSTGAVDILQGDLSNLPERPTSAGVTGAAQGAFSKIQAMARIYGAQVMRPLAYMMAFNTQEFMDEDVFVDISGRHEEELRKEFGLDDGNNLLHVGIEELAVSFDIEPHDGSIPGFKGTQFTQELTRGLLQNEASSQEIFSKLDPVRMLIYAAREAGFDNLRDFFRAGGTGQVNTQVLPDEQVEQQVDAGNLTELQV